MTNAILIHNGHDNLIIRPSFDNKVLIQQVTGPDNLDQVTWSVDPEQLRSLLDSMENADE